MNRADRRAIKHNTFSASRWMHNNNFHNFLSMEKDIRNAIGCFQYDYCDSDTVEFPLGWESHYDYVLDDNNYTIIEGSVFSTVLEPWEI